MNSAPAASRTGPGRDDACVFGGWVVPQPESGGIVLRELLRATLVTLAAFGFIGVGALADHNTNSKALVVDEVVVKFDDAAFGLKDTLTIIGRSLAGRPGRYAIEVMLGQYGPLAVLSPGDTELVVHCFVASDPEFECDDGDYKLKVAIVRGKRVGRRNDDDDDDDGDDDDDDKRRIIRYASYDLTIGAVGPQGVIGATGLVGPIGPQGLPGNDGKDGDPGADGKDGDPGADGKDGDPGADGKDGATGPTGPTGQAADPTVLAALQAQLDTICKNNPLLCQPVKSVFVTAESFNAALDGIAGADALCQAAADDAGLSGDYMAWLSDSTGSPDSRFTKSIGPYALVTGTRISDSYSDLVDGTIFTAINTTESGGSLNTDLVWTGTAFDGTAASPPNDNFCVDWTDENTVNVTSIQVGRLDKNTADWTNFASTAINCGQAYHLYCFEQ